MKEKPEKPQRRTYRLKGYDYSSSGAYFVTLCTANRECLFGKVIQGRVELSPIGRVARDYWLELAKHFPNVSLNEFVVMPNHVHGIVILEKRAELGEKRAEYIQPLQRQNIGFNNVGAQYIEPVLQPGTVQNKYQHIISQSLGSIIRSYKAAVTRWCRQNSFEGLIWQRNYYEHIVRSEGELNAIRQYIVYNALQWELDRENPVSQNYDLKYDKYFEGIYGRA